MKNLNQKLTKYSILNQGILQEVISNKNLQKKVIGTVIPILSVSSAIAQCQGAQTSTFIVGEGNGINIDVDGDGNDDFRIYELDNNAQNEASLVINGLGTGRVLTAGGFGTAVNYMMGQNINGNGTNEYSNVQWLAWRINTDAFGPFGIPFPTSGYIGIKMGSSYGFIQLTVHNGPTPGNFTTDYVISIAEAGLQNANQDVLAGDCSTLPVELTHFSGEASDDAIQLTWSTSTEINNAGFEIERSTDGELFRNIGYQEGSGNSNVSQKYTYEDNTMTGARIIYYRLKQIDYNGAYTYSEIISVDRSVIQNEVGDILPNPSLGGEVSLPVYPKSDGTWKTDILDASGRLISASSHLISRHSTAINIDTSNLPVGTYFVKVTNEESVHFKKLVIQ